MGNIVDSAQAYGNMRGENGPTLTMNLLTQLEKETRFKKTEIQAIYKQFQSEHPDLKVTKDEYKDAVANLGLPPNTLLVNRIWKTYDTNGNGYIDFEDIIRILSTGLRGKKDERITLAFALYDLDGDGVLSEADVMTMTESVFETIHSKATFDPGADSPSRVVNAFFSRYREGEEINYKAFREQVKEGRFFRKGVTLFR